MPLPIPDCPLLDEEEAEDGEIWAPHEVFKISEALFVLRMFVCVGMSYSTAIAISRLLSSR